MSRLENIPEVIQGIYPEGLDRHYGVYLQEYLRYEYTRVGYIRGRNEKAATQEGDWITALEYQVRNRLRQEILLETLVDLQSPEGLGLLEVLRERETSLVGSLGASQFLQGNGFGVTIQWLRVSEQAWHLQWCSRTLEEYRGLSRAPLEEALGWIDHQTQEMQSSYEAEIQELQQDVVSTEAES